MFDKDDLVDLSVYVFWACLFGLLAWAAWEGVTGSVWWGRPLGLASGFLALWILMSLVRKAWRPNA